MNRALRVAAMTLLAVMSVEQSVAARPQLDAEQQARLERTEVLSFSDPVGGGLNKGKSIGLFDATAEEVFRVLTAYERWIEFAPRVYVAQVGERQGEARAFILFKTDLPWPFPDAWVYSQHEHEALGDGGYRIRFWQVRGSMRRYYGSILIESWVSWEGGGKCAVTYEMLAEPNFFAPKRYLNRKLMRATNKWVHALRQYVNTLHAAGQLHPQPLPANGLPPRLVVSGRPQASQQTR